MRLKLFLLNLFCLLGAMCAFGQSNYYKFNVGAGIGGTLVFADVNKQSHAVASYVVVNYNIARFVSAGLEFQKGQLAGGDDDEADYRRQFVNNYLSISANGKIQLGQFLNRRQLQNKWLAVVKGIYFGAGFGLIKNEVSAIRNESFLAFKGTDESMELIFPINVGVNFYFKDSWEYTRYAINLNAQGNIGMADGIDGYTSGRSNDNYIYLSIGFRYHFKKFGLDKKR
jgi:hypothetical protein